MSSILDSALSHTWARELLVAAQRLVQLLWAWPDPAAVEPLARPLTPISSGCPSSVLECLDSLLVNQAALQQFQQQQEAAGVAVPHIDEQVWLGWQELADVLRSLCRALTGIAAAQGNLADATRWVCRVCRCFQQVQAPQVVAVFCVS